MPCLQVQSGAFLFLQSTELVGPAVPNSQQELSLSSPPALLPWKLSSAGLVLRPEAYVLEVEVTWFGSLKDTGSVVSHITLLC